MSIFRFDDYREYVRSWVKASPGGGRGQYQKLAVALGMHTTSVSQVFNGHKTLSLEQAAALAKYLSLNETETDYLMALVEFDRAGSTTLKEILSRRLKRLRDVSQQLTNRLPVDQALSDEAKAVFYSNWFYSAIRLATDTPHLNTPEAIAEYFQLPLSLIREVVEFLLKHGLCTETEEGRLKLAAKRTHLDASSPLISRFHTNWRVKAIERSSRLDMESEVMLSAPMVLSKNDIAKIRTTLLETIEQVVKQASESGSEELYCLNIDWIKMR